MVSFVFYDVMNLLLKFTDLETIIIFLGELGDCWLLAAMASLAMRRDLLDQVIVPNQDFESNYNGKFYFKFWVPHIESKSPHFINSLYREHSTKFKKM